MAVTRQNRVLVVSSANMDFVMKMNKVPVAGETFIDEVGTYSYVPGGKGVNSSLAFAKLGADCVFSTRLGADSHGAVMKKTVEDAGVDTRFVAIDRKEKTGLAAIIVENNGANRIVVYPGANFKLNKSDVEEAFTCYPDALYMQLEIPVETIIASCEFARAQGVPIFIDAGPARAGFPLERLGRVEVFSPNETETEIFTGIAPTNLDQALKAAIKLSTIVDARYYVLKLGSRGAFIYDGKFHKIVPSYECNVVDTTAAGDAFTAALTLEYLRNGDINRATRYGNVVGALTVSRAGASSSIPQSSEVEEFIRINNINL